MTDEPMTAEPAEAQEDAIAARADGTLQGLDRNRVLQRPDSQQCSSACRRMAA